VRRVSEFIAVLFLLVGVGHAAAAQRRVTGRVTEEGSTNPVPSATVSVQGTTLLALTGADGNFAINNVPAGAQTLIARRIGYRRTVVTLSADATTANVSMGHDPLELEEVVVTGQGTSVSSKNAANAVTVISNAEINRVPQPNVENALQGKIPGAVITANSGAPGGGMQVTIRGANTVNGAFLPLYVVDGVVINNDAYSIGLNSITGAGGGITSSQDQQVNRVADLNPEDIADIQVLKGPSAGAIYGSRGANGVVVITTKHGQAGKPAFDFTQGLGSQQLGHHYDMRCFTFDQAVAEAKSDFGITLTPTMYAGCVDPQQTLYGNHELSYETNLSMRGGTNDAATTYFMSGTLKHDAGLSVNSGASRQSLLMNVNQVAGSRLNLRASSQLLHTLTERGISGNDNNNIAPYTIMGTTPTYFDFSKTDPVTGKLVKNPFIAGGANPLQDMQEIRTPEEVFRLLGTAQGDLSILSSASHSINASLQGGIDALNDHNHVYSPPDTYIEQSGNISPYPGSVIDGNTDAVNANLNATLVDRFTTGLGIATTSVGLRQEHASVNSGTVRGQGLFPGVTNFSTAVQTGVTQTQLVTRTFSYFAQEEFLAMNEKLMLTAAVNAERSSTNGDSAAFFAFPKFAASYNLPLHSFGLDNVKFRVATGQAGNRVPNNFKYTFLTQALESGIVGLRPSATVGLSGVTPEHTAETEGGADIEFLHGRAQAEVTFYKKTTNDLVLQSAPPPSSGFTTKIINGGELTNSGQEIGLSILAMQNSLLTWQSHTTFSHNKGLVTSLPVPAFYTGSIFSERYGRTKVQVGYAPDEVVAYNGFNADGSRHEQFFGSESPDFEMGFANDFTHGPFRLSTSLEWRHGGYLANLSQTYLEDVSGQSAITGGNFANTVMDSVDQAGFKAGQSVFLEHASFAKLREVTLSYALSPKLTTNLFHGSAKDARLNISGRNLYTWTRYRGLDPEVSNFGDSQLSRMQDLAPYPPSRQFFFSISANF
jgi:TonB-dependent starch-binding outer membrane protein SusC